jgi:hypothetical protein
LKEEKASSFICGAYCEVSVETLKGSYHLGDLSVDGMILLKWILRK